MKTAFTFILIAFAFTPNTFAQETSVFPTDSAYWRLYYTCYDGGQPYDAQVPIEIVGDTIINNENYIELKEGNWNYFYAKVEDKKVYFKNHYQFPDTSDYLIYDFGLEAGDVFYYPGFLGYQDSTIIEVIDTVLLLDGTSHRRLKLTTSYENICGYTDYWIEGIGGSMMPFYFMDCFECGLNGYRFYQKNELVFTSIIVNTEEIEAQSKVMVYPNPVGKTFKVDTGYSKNMDLRLIDLMGREVFRKKAVGNNTEIQVPSSIPEGIYLLEITFDDGNQVVKKIILE